MYRLNKISSLVEITESLLAAIQLFINIFSIAAHFYRIIKNYYSNREIKANL